MDISIRSEQNFIVAKPVTERDLREHDGQSLPVDCKPMASESHSMPVQFQQEP